MIHLLKTIAFLLVISLIGACGATKEQKQDPYFTSGSREADQRAEQRVARDKQVRTDEGSSAKAKKPLYDRLGGEEKIHAMVDDFVDRALADPRVNWERKGVTQGGIGIHSGKSVEWNASPENVAQLKKHLAQFLALATGGPASYDGREMKDAHKTLHISNAEFDAAVGDLKSSLDKLGVPTTEEKELLAIIESTRPQVVEER